MSREDQRLQDLLPSFSTDIFRAFHDHVNDPIIHVADTIDGHVSAISDYLREVIVSSSWIPDSMKLSGPAMPSWQAPPPPPPSILERAQTSILRNRAVSAALVSFLSTGAFLIWRRRRLYRMKRRAKRAAGGEKVEVIVLAGSPHSPLVSSLALDLDRRGFIIYITVCSTAEEEATEALHSKDIHPLRIDVTSPNSIASAITNFGNRLFSSSSHNILRLASLIFLPPHPNPYPDVPIYSIASSTWSRMLNSQLLLPFTLAHAFIPILSTFAKNNQLQQSTCPQMSIPFLPNFMSRYTQSSLAQSSKISLMVLSTSITPSFCSVNNAIENVIFASTRAWLRTLHSEIATSGSSLRIIDVHLGSFEDGNEVSTGKELAIARQNYFHIQNSRSSSRLCSEVQPASPQQPLLKGSWSRELHNGVFDAVVGTTARYGGTLYIGRGSLVYAMVGNLFPRTIIGWMMRSNLKGAGWPESAIYGSDDVRDGSWSESTAEWEDVNVLETQI